MLIMLGLELAVLAAAAAIVDIGVNILTFALSGIAIIADVLISLGAALVVLAVGLILLWFALWLIIVSVRGLVRGIVSLGKKFCVREVVTDG